LWKSSPVNPWHAMFCIFPRWYITHHDSMQCFSIFLNFFEFPWPPSRSRSNSRCHWCVPGGLGTMVWSWLQGPTHSGDLQVIFPNFSDVHFL
jgi:hypothetical protein